MQSMPINRLKLSDAVGILKNMTGVTRTRHTIYNWCIDGRLSYSGVRIYLGHEIVLGRCYTTKADLRKFIEELRI